MSDIGSKSRAVGNAFLAAFGLLRRAISPSNVRTLTEEEARQVQAEFELLERRDKALRQKYASAITQLPELARRAEAHGVAFSSGTAPYRRAAILDFLDNPKAATDLDYAHFTACFPSPSLPGQEQTRMWGKILDLAGTLMRRDDAGWSYEAWLSAQPAFAPEGQVARARAQRRAASAGTTPPQAERR